MDIEKTFDITECFVIECYQLYSSTICQSLTPKKIALKFKGTWVTPVASPSGEGDKRPSIHQRFLLDSLYQECGFSQKRVTFRVFQGEQEVRG